MIRTEGLTKRFGRLTAVDGLDLDVREGDLFGFLGPNGSGKTTTVRMLLGLVFATSGRIEVLGRPMPKAAHEVLPQVGSLVEGPAFYPHLSGRANLALFDAAGPDRSRSRPSRFWAGLQPSGAEPPGSGPPNSPDVPPAARPTDNRDALHPPGPASGPPVGERTPTADGGRGVVHSPRTRRRQRIDEALARVGLDGVGRRPVRAWSTGMRQRLGLAAALLRAPRLLVLDEPTNGLDPHGMREVRDLLVELVKGGTTVFLSSHLLAEVELVCTRAAIVDRGRLVAQGRVDALLGPTGRVLVTTPDVGVAADLAAALPGVRPGELRPDRLAVHLDGTAPEALNRRLVDGGVRVRELVVERPTLEDVFLLLTSGLAGAEAAGRPDAGPPPPEEDRRVPG
ncbi:MAG TPA: ABC transporter ATP-binding protein [Actinomycetota bacterium]